MVSKLGITEYNLRVLLYDGSGVQTVKLQSLYNAYLKSGARDTFAAETLYILKNWVSNEKDDDYENFEEMGITESTFENFLDLVVSLRTNLSMNIHPDQDNEEKNWPLDTLYYKLYGDKILNIINGIQEILDEAPSELLDEKNIVYHESMLRNNTIMYTIIGNPYYGMQRVIDTVRESLAYYEDAEINVNMFNYEQKFMILKNFYDNIIKEDLDEEETNELVLNWQRLLIHSFSYSQIRNNVEPDTTYNIFAKLTEKELYLRSNYSELSFCFNKFESRIDDIDEEKIKKIYQKHINDKVGEILRPLVEDLIPYYNYLHTNDGLAELTLKLTNEGESLFLKKVDNEFRNYGKKEKKILAGSFLIGDKYINGVYFSAIKFELKNLPDESYQRLFNMCLDGFLYQSTMQMSGSPMNIEADEINLLDYPDPENDLIAQKYYIVWLMVKYFNENCRLYSTPHKYWAAAVFLSIIPWRIQSDSEYVRNVESLLKNNIINCVKNYDFVDDKLIDLKDMTKYIQNTVWKATKPLNVNSIDRVFSTQYEGACCNIF